MEVILEVYLDNSATTKVSQGVADIVTKVMIEDFGNPSSMHMKGVEAERYLKDAKDIIAKNMKVNAKEIFFTSGGTESNNLAIIGAAMANKRSGMHIITTKIEHPSVLNCMKYLEEEGFEVTYLDVDEYGVLDVKSLEEKIRQDTILVSIMYVNNEIGSVLPIEEIGKMVKNKNPKTLFHVDAIQAFGKYKIYPKKLGINLLSVSGHKIHGPKGIGFLYISEGTKVKPIILGGGQQGGIRSGTDNVSGVAGLGQAVKEVYEGFEEKISNMRSLKDFLIDELSEMEKVKVNSVKTEFGAPHIISASFVGVRSEVMLHSLEDKAIYVSAGSACAAKKVSTSATLSAIGLGKEELDSTIRFSICDSTRKEELEYTIETIKELLPRLRMFVRKK